ncbi:unnamed protein product [Linum trigynum]|uniref:F-box domain-containing protein n=1 Tax=Linum trigynum TaxID=586398 RepID=A0AAV2F421_9ROSI
MMEQVCEYSGDRITDLPADVIQRILVFLPIKDAAKTSILSRKWRHQWRGIKELVLQLSTELYKVHSSLFSALHLETLELGCCEITPPSWSVGFSKLTNLQLVGVTLPYDFFENFLPKCPMLEHLVVVCCDGPAGELQIMAPYLKDFIFVGSKDVFIKCSTLPLLVSLYPLDTGNPSMISWFASPSTHRELQDSFLEECLFPGDDPFSKAEVLNMNHLVFDSWEMEHSIVLAIMTLPNLRRLAIKLETSQLHDDQPTNDRVNSIQRVLEAENCTDVLQHLSELRIEDSLCGPLELDLVTFVLVTAPRLRLIHITPFYQLSSKKVIKFKKEVMKCRRVSKKAEVIYDWNDAEED